MGRALLAFAFSLHSYDKPQKQPLMVSLAIAVVSISSIQACRVPAPPRLSSRFAIDVTIFCKNTHPVARRETIDGPLCDAISDRAALRACFQIARQQSRPSKCTLLFLMESLEFYIC